MFYACNKLIKVSIFHSEELDDIHWGKVLQTSSVKKAFVDMY